MEIIKSKGPEIFDIELEKDLLAKNRNLAKENRKRFDRSDILAIDIMGSVGSGKTSLIKAILKRLRMGEAAAVIVLNKIDLTKAMKVNPFQLGKDAHKINPHVPFILANVLKGVGIPKVINALGLKP